MCASLRIRCRRGPTLSAILASRCSCAHARRRQGCVLRLVWAKASRRLRYRPLLPFCGLALRRRLEPDAGVKANQQSKIEWAGNASCPGARERNHHGLVGRCFPGGRRRLQEPVLPRSGTDLAAVDREPRAGGHHRCDDGASHSLGERSRVAAMGASTGGKAKCANRDQGWNRPRNDFVTSCNEIKASSSAIARYLSAILCVANLNRRYHAANLWLSAARKCRQSCPAWSLLSGVRRILL
jgi:hypothetical protein